jgi:hypothetical protein
MLASIVDLKAGLRMQSKSNMSQAIKVPANRKKPENFIDSGPLLCFECLAGDKRFRQLQGRVAL